MLANLLPLAVISVVVLIQWIAEMGEGQQCVKNASENKSICARMLFLDYRWYTICKGAALI